jgi:IS30 family transposase
MDRRYKHLNREERGVIFAEHRREASPRAIGSLLGRHASTISRELRHGQCEDGHYTPEASRRGYDQSSGAKSETSQTNQGGRAAYLGAGKAGAFGLVPGTNRGQAPSYAS